MTTEQGRKRRNTMITKIMREMELNLEEATQIYYENQRQKASKAGNGSNRYKFTKEDGLKGLKTRWERNE